MKRCIHLLTKRVCGHNRDNTPVIEKITVKLEDGANFSNFLSHMGTKGYLMSEPPRVVRVIELKKDGKTWGDVDLEPYQARVKAALAPKLKKTDQVDYKAVIDDQAKAIAELREELNAIKSEASHTDTPEIPVDSILGEAEISREALEARAKSLNIQYPANIKSGNLLNKIKDVDPDFKG